MKNVRVKCYLFRLRSNRSYSSTITQENADLDPTLYDVATRIWDGRWHLVPHSKEGNYCSTRSFTAPVSHIIYLKYWIKHGYKEMLFSINILYVRILIDKWNIQHSTHFWPWLIHHFKFEILSFFFKLEINGIAEETSWLGLSFADPIR